jgi:hypothetical protein
MGLRKHKEANVKKRSKDCAEKNQVLRAAFA